jgi:hypothetical protein
MNGRLLLTDYAVFLTYENIAMQLAIRRGRADHLRHHRQDRCGIGRAPYAPGPTGVWGLCAGIRRSAFCLYELTAVRLQVLQLLQVAKLT